MIDFVRKGDVIYIIKLDRLTKSGIVLYNIIKFLDNKYINLKVLHQNINTTSPADRLLFTMLGAIAEFER
jgi:DNA invertase Pin-like site-specific DNA recombinase